MCSNNGGSRGGTQGARITDGRKAVWQATKNRQTPPPPPQLKVWICHCLKFPLWKKKMIGNFLALNFGKYPYFEEFFLNVLLKGKHGRVIFLLTVRTRLLWRFNISVTNKGNLFIYRAFIRKQKLFIPRESLSMLSCIITEDISWDKTRRSSNLASRKLKRPLIMLLEVRITC